LEGKPIGADPKKKSLKESSWFGETKCKLRSKVAHFFVFCPCCSSFVKLEDMIWIEDIVIILAFLTNSKVDMASFVDLHKVVVKRNAFLAFSHA
jgi:hypothetical protein